MEILSGKNRGNHHYLVLDDETTRATKSSERSGSGRRFLISIAATIPVVVLAAGVLLLSFLTLKISNTDANFGCDPQGQIWVTKAHRPNLWSHTYGLAITLGVGAFTFTEAKAIDIAWDLLVARGAQVIAVIIIYYVFRGPLAVSMQQSAVPYEKIVKMQYHTGGWNAFFSYCGDLTGKLRSRFHTFAAWILAISAGYTLLIPTLVSAMTGYQPISLPLLMLTNNTFVSFDALTHCAYVIQDGPRIGLDSMACIQSGSIEAGQIASYIDRYVTYNYTGGWTANAHPPSAIQIASLLPTPNQRHRWIPAPLLNITQNNFQDPLHTVFYDNRSFSAADLATEGLCSPQPSFRWGFSLILLFMFLSVTCLISVFIYIVWLGHYWRRANGSDDVKLVFGDLRTPLAVGESIREELGLDTSAQLTDEQLKAAVGSKGHGLRLPGLRRNRESQYEGMRRRTTTFPNVQPSHSGIPSLRSVDQPSSFKDEFEMSQWHGQHGASLS